MTQSEFRQGQSVSISRRSLLKAISRCAPGIALGPAVLQTACSMDVPLTINSLTDSLALISGAGCNVLVKRAAGGEVLVVDGGLEENAGVLLDTIAEASGSDNITTLMNTHWHREHTGLNAALGQAGCRIFAHENTRQWLSVEVDRPWEDFTFAPLPEQARPNETFYFYGDFEHHGALAQYGNMVQAHTDGDMYVYFPEDNVLHAGGVVNNDEYVLIDWWTGGWLGGLVNGLETLINIGDQDTLVVPGSGPVMSMVELLAMRDMYDTIFQRIRSLFIAANSPQETLESAPTAEFDARWGDPERFVLLAHQSLIPHYAPDA